MDFLSLMLDRPRAYHDLTYIFPISDIQATSVPMWHDLRPLLLSVLAGMQGRNSVFPQPGERLANLLVLLVRHTC